MLMSAPEYLRCIKSGAKGVPSPACIFVEIARDPGCSNRKLFVGNV